MGFIKWLFPPKLWQVPVIFLSAIFLGLFLYLFYISKAYSYLSDKPETCMNCHIMAPQYATWNHSAHREVANCNDCHVPHNNAFNKYYFKAKDGLRHAAVFTLRNEPQVIYLREEGHGVIQNNCIRCHENQLIDSKMLVYTDEYNQYRMDRKCWECHRETPHGRVNSLSSVPYARVPVPDSPVPEWLDRLVKKD